MSRALHITGSDSSRLTAQRVLFCGGGVDASFRPGIDLELSHWIPNDTPHAFRADTSTEICLNFIAAGEEAAFDLVVNNHVDVDGVLSTLVLMYPELALPNRRILAQAADMGEFAGWGDAAGQTLFQLIARLIHEMRVVGADAQEIYLRCFDCARQLLAGRSAIPGDLDGGLAALHRCAARIAQGEIDRRPTGEHFVHYRLPAAIAMTDPSAALETPAFSAPISERALLPPQARSRLDKERVQLVSVELSDGWRHDLTYPGYSWADTVTLWRPPGLRHAGDSNVHDLDHRPLTAAVRKLAQRELGAGEWRLARRLSPFAAVKGRNFPVVLSFLKDGEPAPSSWALDELSDILASAFAE
jgi:hypothetical protein